MGFPREALELRRGRLYIEGEAVSITAGDNDNMAMVVVLGTSVVEDLFGSTQVNPVGETVRINRQNYEVIGVLKSKGTSGPQNQDDVILMPLRTAQLKLGGAGTTTVRSINLQVRSADEMDLAQAQVTRCMAWRPALRMTSWSGTRRTS